jgi:hypothetical protein
MDTTTMRVLVVEPGKRPIVKEIETGLEPLQKAVGGLIEAVYPFEEPVAIVCNEEGKLLELPLNRALLDENGHVYDIIAGTFLVVGLTEDNFGSLDDALLEQFQTRFRQPETFVYVNGHLKVIPWGDSDAEGI